MTDTDTLPHTPPTPPAAARPPARGGLPWRGLLALAVVAALGAGGWLGWRELQALDAGRARAAEDASVRLAGVEDAAGRLRDGQRSLESRLQANQSTNAVLREELLGIGQRARLLEDSVARLAEAQAADPRGEQRLRLAEAELLLAMGANRLTLFGDAPGAERAYVLAAEVLAGVDAPAAVDARQSLQQELAALRALPEDPRAVAAGELDALLVALDALPVREAAEPAEAEASATERVLGRFVSVRQVRGAVMLPSDREAARTAMELELTLARAALERRDDAGFQRAIGRVDTWLQRLYPASPERDARIARLRELAARPLRVELPVLGSTLAQLRGLSATRMGAGGTPEAEAEATEARP